MAEADESAEITAQYHYLEDHRPVLMLQGEQAFVIHTDHLGKPRVVSDEQGEIRWQASYTPFGKAIITQADIDLPLRFQGQYADAESGTHYNYLRDYDPETGRYLRSDPIGLGGGLNTYAYVAGNPLGAIDPLGLQALPNPTVAPEAWRIIRIQNLGHLVDLAQTPANQTIPPHRVGVPVSSVLRGMARLGGLVGLAFVAHDLGEAGAALADALVFAPADQAELLAHIHRYDPDYVPTGTAAQLDRHGIRALGEALLQAQRDYLNDNSFACGVDYDHQLYTDAQWAVGQNDGFTILSQDTIREQFERFHREYQANGGTLSFEDWLSEGMPNEPSEDSGRVFTNSGSGTNHVRHVSLDGIAVSINSGHAYDREHVSGDVRDTGLSRDTVENA